jgi:oligosaccharide repeat unit polymerase
MILLVLVNKYLYKSFLNPIFLQSLIWLVYYIILAANINKYDVYLKDVNTFMVLQLVGFSLGGFCNYIISPRAALYKQEINLSSVSITERNVNFLFPCISVLLVICLLAVVRQSGSISIFSIDSLRAELIEDDGKSYGLFGTIQFILSVYFLAYFATTKQFIQAKFIILFIAFLYYTLMLGSRQAFLFFFGALGYVLLWMKKIKKTHLLLFGLILLGFFLALTFLRAHDEEDDNLLLNIFLAYTVTSLPALALTTIKQSAFWGTYTFRNIYLWLNKAGFSFYIVPILNEFTGTPYYTNVYSYMRPYYFDFNYIGVFLFPFILGFLNNWVYFRAAKGKLGSLLVLGLLVFPLVMQIFDELYFNWFSNWLYFTIFILILTKTRIYEIGRSRRNISSVAS